MRDGEALVSLALLTHALGPVVHGQVRPVVVAFFQLGPGVLEHLLPGLVAEQRPQRRGADLHAVVVVGLVGGRELEQGVTQLGQIQFEGLQRPRTVSRRRGSGLIPCCAAPSRQRGRV